MTDRHVPYRTCVATRRRLPASQLLRVVVDEPDTARRVAAGEPVTVVVPDPGRCLPGRGAWVTPDASCVDMAVTRRAFQRALKTPHRVDASAVLAHVSARTDEAE